MPKMTTTPQTTRATPATLLLGLALTLAPAAALAQPQVPDGFTIRQIAPLLDGVVPRLEAVSDSQYGFGVVSVSISGQILTVRKIDRTGDIAVIGVLDSPAPLEQIFVAQDQTGVFGGLLHLSYVDRTDCPTISTIVTVDADGVFTTVLETDRAEDWGLRLAFSDGAAGLPIGGILHDGCKSGGGNALLSLETGYAVRVEAPDSNPPGRTDMDIRELQQDSTGLYGGGILIADTDVNDDRLSAIYELREVLSGGTFRAITEVVGTSVRQYSDMAIEDEGTFGGVIYVGEQLTSTIQTVDPTGLHQVWATGFQGSPRLAIAPDGQSMYVADESGVWLIRPSGAEPGPVVLATDPSTPAGSTLSGAPVTSLRIIFNEPVDFTDADVTITDKDGDPVAFDASGSGSQFMLIGLGAPLDGDTYTVTIADTVRSVATGEQFDGDRDGVAGGDAELVFAHACRADFDGDGSLTLFDFLAFQNAFDAGCP